MFKTLRVSDDYEIAVEILGNSKLELQLTGRIFKKVRGKCAPETNDCRPRPGNVIWWDPCDFCFCEYTLYMDIKTTLNKEIESPIEADDSTDLTIS